MTTIREHCERGIVPDFIRKYWKENKGQIPLCCFETTKTDSGWVIKCTWLKTWYSFAEFKLKCMACQVEIAKYLEGNGYRSISSSKEDCNEKRL